MYIYTACWLNNYVVQLCSFWCNSYGARLSRLLTLFWLTLTLLLSPLRLFVVYCFEDFILYIVSWLLLCLIITTTALWHLKCLQNQETKPGAELDRTKDTLRAESNCEDSESHGMVACDRCKLRVSLPSFDIIECYSQEAEVSSFLQRTSSCSRGRLVLWWQL